MVDAMAEEQGLLRGAGVRRLGDAVIAPQRTHQCPLLILLGVQGAENVRVFILYMWEIVWYLAAAGPGTGDQGHVQLVSEVSSLSS